MASSSFNPNVPLYGFGPTSAFGPAVSAPVLVSPGAPVSAPFVPLPLPNVARQSVSRALHLSQREKELEARVRRLEVAARCAKEREATAKEETAQLAKESHERMAAFYTELATERQARIDAEAAARKLSADLQQRQEDSGEQEAMEEVARLQAQLKLEREARHNAEKESDQLRKLAAKRRDQLSRLSRKRRAADLAAAENIAAAEQAAAGNGDQGDLPPPPQKKRRGRPATRMAWGRISRSARYAKLAAARKKAKELKETFEKDVGQGFTLEDVTIKPACQPEDVAFKVNLAKDRAEQIKPKRVFQEARSLGSQIPRGQRAPLTSSQLLHVRKMLAAKDVGLITNRAYQLLASVDAGMVRWSRVLKEMREQNKFIDTIDISDAVDGCRRPIRDVLEKVINLEGLKEHIQSKKRVQLRFAADGRKTTNKKKNCNGCL